MTDTITLTGLVATLPRHLITAEGLSVTSFRLASALRRFDRKSGKWVDAGTNWYTVSTFRELANNVVGSIQKGDRIIATGRLRIRDWESGDRKGTSVEIDADAVGHDLSWGKALFTRSIQSAVIAGIAEEFAQGENSSGDTDQEQFPSESTFAAAGPVQVEEGQPEANPAPTEEVPVPF